MRRPIINQWVLLHEQTWARVYLNDVPLYRTPFMGPDSRSGPVNYLLVPGENEVKIELLKARNNLDGTKVEDSFMFQLYTVDNPDAAATEKLERTMLVDFRFPKIWTDAVEEHQHYPFYFHDTFSISQDVHKPVWVDAPTAEFDCAGTPELREAVQRIYDRLDGRDYDGLLNELALKFESDEKAYEGEEAQRAEIKMQTWRTELLAYEPRPAEPLDMSLIHFEPRRGGQVAHVTRHDDSYVLDAICEKDPKRRIRTDLLMVQHKGRWRVFA